VARVSDGWCAPEVSEAFPQLRLVLAETQLHGAVSLTAGSPPGVRARLRELSNRWSGAQAVMLRGQAVPGAYRLFCRHIGLDPDVQRTPLEQAVMRRLLDGGFLARGLLEDVLLLALVDTGVAVWALDAATLDGPLGVRTSKPDEPLGRTQTQNKYSLPPTLPAGQLVVADASTALAVLFEQPAPAHRARADSRQLTLYALQVEGVSELHVQEALWSCTSTLEAFDQGL
jgi:DNA/RNA-binding domain of Phe-tRNA-synthetase-like protein